MGRVVSGVGFVAREGTAAGVTAGSVTGRVVAGVGAGEGTAVGTAVGVAARGVAGTVASGAGAPPGGRRRNCGLRRRRFRSGYRGGTGNSGGRDEQGRKDTKTSSGLAADRPIQRNRLADGKGHIKRRDLPMYLLASVKL